MVLDSVLPQPLGLSYATVACHLGCSVDYVRKLVREGTLDVVRISPRKVFVTRDSIERLLRERNGGA